ncbi:SapC family protein [Thalassomonas viridans]|uniref:SapC family protein n=1 Tax=Thalassomonas viridans TaxID=137584 RepID=A0AAE9Z2P2_9GAMM|nr:SapC family protein [Thalassomonas viridans]WDE05463.1 SapC family protein [Thalassomonas viridans]
MANMVPVKKEQHQNLKVAAKRDLSHVANQHIVPVNAIEFAQAATSFPVVIVKDPDSNRYRSVAMLGLETGENLFYSKEKWNAIFVPQSIGMVPFALGLDPEKEKTLTACIDTDSPFVGEDKENALFDDKGEETEFLKKIQESLGRLYDNEVASERFIKELVDNDLLQELELNMSLVSGEKKKLVGIFTVNEKKLQELSDEKVVDFHKRGLFVPLHAMLGSVAQVNRLVQLRNENSDKKINGIQISPVAAEAEAK